MMKLNQTKTSKPANNILQAKYAAVVNFDTNRVVRIELSCPLKSEEVAAIKQLEQNSGISILDIPSDCFYAPGYYVVLSNVWDRVEVAEECVNILITLGFTEANISPEFRQHRQ